MNAVAQRYAAAQALARPLSSLCLTVRLVVLDTETTGLDPRTDRLISIGAVAWEAGDVRLDDTFEIVIPVAYNKSAVTLHGITRDESQAGVAEPEALALFLEYLGADGVIGHHLDHDWRMLQHAAKEHFALDDLVNPRIDTALLAERLADAGAFGQAGFPGTSLDALCAYFNLVPHDRHTATGDAFLTAMVFQRLVAMARRQGWERLQDLVVTAEAGS